MDKLTLRVLKGLYGVCRLNKEDKDYNFGEGSEFYSFSKTEDEISIICREDLIPKEIKYEGGWSVLKVQGPLDFSLVGILSSISNALASRDISIFAVSTYDTDYVLVKKLELENAVFELIERGYDVVV